MVVGCFLYAQSTRMVISGWNQPWEGRGKSYSLARAVEFSYLLHQKHLHFRRDRHLLRGPAPHRLLTLIINTFLDLGSHATALPSGVPCFPSEADVAGRDVVAGGAGEGQQGVVVDAGHHGAADAAGEGRAHRSRLQTLRLRQRPCHFASFRHCLSWSAIVDGRVRLPAPSVTTYYRVPNLAGFPRQAFAFSLTVAHSICMEYLLGGGCGGQHNHAGHALSLVQNCYITVHRWCCPCQSSTGWRWGQMEVVQSPERCQLGTAHRIHRSEAIWSRGSSPFHITAVTKNTAWRALSLSLEKLCRWTNGIASMPRLQGQWLVVEGIAALATFGESLTFLSTLHASVHSHIHILLAQRHQSAHKNQGCSLVRGTESLDDRMLVTLSIPPSALTDQCSQNTLQIKISSLRTFKT